MITVCSALVSLCVAIVAIHKFGGNSADFEALRTGFLRTSKSSEDPACGGRLPYPDTERRRLLGKAFYAMGVDDWKTVLEATSPVLQSADNTLEERFCGHVLRWFSLSRLNRTREASTEYAALAENGRLLPPDHELRRAWGMIKKLYRNEAYSAEEDQGYGIVKGDLMVECPNPGTVRDPDNAMHWLYLSTAQDADRMALAYARRILCLPTAGTMDKGRALYHSVLLHHRLHELGEARQAVQQFNDLYRANPDASFASTDTFWGSHLTDIAVDLRALERSLGMKVTTPVLGVVRAPYRPPFDPAFWPTKTPLAANLSAHQQRALKEMATLFEDSGADAGLILYRGNVLYERYSRRYYPPLGVSSVTKTWTAILAGMLIADGRIGSVDDPVNKYVSSWQGGQRNDVTLKHLLTQTAGVMDSPGCTDSMVLDSEESLQGVVPAAIPGTQWSYSNTGVQLLSLCLENGAKIPLDEYARTRLFVPLGMNETTLMRDKKGRTVGFGGGQTSARDMARLTYMLSKGGKWRGQQIVPAAWVRVMQQPVQTQGSQSQKDYGYLLWLFGQPKGFYMAGDGDNYCFCFPDKDLIIIRLQNGSNVTATRIFLNEVGPLVSALTK